MVDLLKNDSEKQEKLNHLRHYLYTIKQAIDGDQITLDSLQKVSQLSTDQTNLFRRKRQDTSVKIPEGDQQLYESYTSLADIFKPYEEDNLGAILDDGTESSLGQALLDFDEEQADYLSLCPLASSNKETILEYLNDIASIGLIFAPHVSIKSIDGSGSKSVSLDKVGFQQSKTQWLQKRPIRVHAFSEGAAHQVGILEKFLANQLQLDEWLTDNDIEREVKCLRQKDEKLPAITVCRFNVEDIGMALHFAREANKDNTTPYQIPFILNLGAKNHASLTERGTHWVRALVTVDPSHTPLQITVNYTDPLRLHPVDKQKVTQTLQRAINYRTQVGRLGTGQQIQVYQAFPEVDSPTITVEGSAEQHDGYSCGYRAIKGIVGDLVEKEIIEREAHEELLACETSQELTDIIYQDLISEQRIDSETYNRLSAQRKDLYSKLAGDTEYSIDKDTVLGEIHRLRYTLSREVIREGKQTMQTAKQLKALAKQYRSLKQLNANPIIKEIAESKGPKETVNLNTLIAKIKEKDESCDQDTIALALLEAINNNDKITELDLNLEDSGASLTSTISHFLDTNLTLKNITLACEDESLKAQAQATAIRNDYLKTNHIRGTKKPWQSLFGNLIFSIPQKQEIFYQLPKELADNEAIRQQFLQFLQENGDAIADDSPFTSLDLSHETLFQDIITQEKPELPFNHFRFTINNENQLQEELLPFLKEVPANRLSLTLDDSITDQAITQLLTQLKNDSDFNTQIYIARKKPLQDEARQDLQSFYNEIEKRRRSKVKAPASNNPYKPVTEPTGPIGRAMLGEMGNLAAEIQVQQQQQQQQQQQVQSSSAMDAEEDETEVSQEVYPFFDSDEELINRENIATILGDFINEKTALTPKRCCDLITGSNSAEFKHAIKKMTKSAAEKLIDSLECCQYGLNLDNLPKGFYVAEKGGEIVLAYNALQPIFNANESPLTLRLTKIPQSQQWLGNMHQFLTMEQCKKLYNKLFPAPGLFQRESRPTLEHCVANFFFLTKETPPLSRDKYETILQAILSAQGNDDIAQKIVKVFSSPNELSPANYRALFEVIYSGRQQQLNDWLDTLSDLKIKNIAHFHSFKRCFIETCPNWNALLDEQALQSLSIISQYSEKKLLWWQNLTEQHAENPALKKENPGASQITKRWQDLTYAQQGFDYFWEEAKDLGFEPVDAEFPLHDVADMHSGLERLLTILRNAKDINEQMTHLQQLSLDSLDAFYASRYEGFRLVTAPMDLRSSSITFKEDRAEGCQHRLKKEDITITGSDDKITALFLRYIALYNHRQPISNYLTLLEQIKIQPYYNNLQMSFIGDSIIPLLFSLLAKVTTGRKNKGFSFEEIINLFDKIGLNGSNLDEGKLLNKICDINSYLVQTMHPSLSELTKILESTDDTEKDSSHTFKMFLPVYTKEDNSQDKKCQQTLFKGLVKFSSQTNKKIAWLKSKLLIYSNPEEGIVLNKKFTYFNDDRLLTAKLVRVFACIAKANKPEAEIDTALFYNNLQKIHRENNTLAHQVIDILGQIDLVNSTRLPSTRALANLFTAITSNSDKAQADLRTFIADNLDGIEYELDIDEQTQQTTQVNPHAVLAKHMGTIINELNTLLSNPLFKTVLTQAGLNESFLEQLKSANGAAILMDSLDSFKELKTQFEEEKAKNLLLAPISLNSLLSPIQKALSKVYDNLLNDTKSEFKDLGNHVCALLKLLQHPLKTVDFDAFCADYAKELGYLNSTIDDLKGLQCRCPEDFSVFINTLVKQQIPLKKYSIADLSQFLAKVISDYPTDKKLPIQAFAQLLTLEPKKANSVLSVLLEIDDESLSYPLNLQAYEQITNLATKESIDSTAIKHLLKKYHEKSYFNSVVTLVNTPDVELSVIDKNIDKLQGLNDESINILCQNSLSDFIALSEALTNCDEGQRQTLFDILHKAITCTAKDKEVSPDDKTNLIAALSKKSKQDLSNILSLYATKVSPDVTTLTTGLDDLKHLIDQYDINPNGIHNDNDKLYDDENFSSYVEKLIDLNYERILLRSERETLHQHLLYINYLGYQQFPESGGLPIKDRSRVEILELIEQRRNLLKNSKTTPTEKTKAQLELIALLREVMLRTTGMQARPNQLLFLVTAMLKGENFIGQIPTGQGKSLTSAMQAALKHFEGQTVDICTSTTELANEGLGDYNQFYGYLKIPAKLITARALTDDYQAGAIHYSSLSELALYRSKAVLQGKQFPKDSDSCLIIDEVDYSAFDDSTEYRVATDIDKVTQIGVNPYEWIYAIIIDYVDNNIKQGRLLSDNDFLKEAKNRISEMAQGKQQKQSLASLKASGQYDKRLNIWLTAAATSNQLVNYEEVHSDNGQPPKKVRFRVIQETSKVGDENKVVSKACIVEGGKMHAKAQFSHGVQQFLEMRLRKKYQAKIDKNLMPDFAIPTEKSCIMALNSRLMFESYKQRYGLSGTAIGSRDETFELQTKYGFKIVDIPSHAPSKRQVLKPILTNSKFLNDSKKEELDHIKLIVKEVIRHIAESPSGKCPPLLIHCSDKAFGQQISQALQTAIDKKSPAFKAKLTTNITPRTGAGVKNLILETNTSIKEFYGSECEVEEEKLEQARQYRAQAGQSGTITISSVFGRGTDIQPKHEQGLYSIQTYIDTEAYSSEDLVRLKTQKFGRSARDKDKGCARLIIKRSEFKPVLADKKLKELNNKPSITKIERLIQALNKIRNYKRSSERQQREAIGTIKHYFQRRYTDILNIYSQDASLKQEAEQLTATWRGFLEKIDTYLKSARETSTLINGFSGEAIKLWNEELAQFEEKPDYSTLQEYVRTNPLWDKQELLKAVKEKQPPLLKHYVGSFERLTIQKKEADIVFCEMNPDASRKDVVYKKVNKVFVTIKSDNRLKKAIKHPRLNEEIIDTESSLKTLIASLLHIRYKALRDGDKQLCQRANKQLSSIVYWCNEFSNDDQQSQAVREAFQEHIQALYQSTGKKPATKLSYVTQLHQEITDYKLKPKETPMEIEGKSLTTLQWNGHVQENITIPGLKSYAVKQLLTYSNSWKKYLWVNKDRKRLAQKLKTELEEINEIREDNATQVLEVLNNTRLELLRNDAIKNKVFAAGIEGRLNNILNNIENQVIAMLPEHRKEVFQYQVQHALKVIELACGKLSHKSLQNEELKRTLKETIKKARFNNLDMPLVNINDSLNLHLAKHGEKASSESYLLSRYCKSQIKKLKGLAAKEEQHIKSFSPATFYDRIAKNTSQLINTLSKSKKNFKSPRITKDLTSIIYGDFAVKVNHDFHLDPKKIQESNFYKFVNQPGIFYALLEKLEEQLVENSGENIRLKFESINFAISDKFSKGFKLEVKLSHQWQKGSITFHFNSDNQRVYCESSINEIKPEKMMSSVTTQPSKTTTTEQADKATTAQDSDKATVTTASPTLT